MNNKGRASYQEVYWDDVKDAVKRANPELADVINGLKTKNKYPLCIVRYPFGSPIIDAGNFHFPLKDGTLLPIHHHRLSAHIRSNFGYHDNSIPLGIVLRRSIELYMYADDRIIPYSLLNTGKMFGLWSTLTPEQLWLRSIFMEQVWHMTAGARSLFVLPKITNIASHKKLCRARGIKIPVPRSLVSHWSFLTRLANHTDFSHEWHTELLLFSEGWLKKQNDLHWIKFHHFLYQEAWGASEYWRRKIVYDHIWDKLIRDLSRQDIKANPAMINIAKHIIMVSLGASPGFCPAINDNEAPVKGLQDDFIKLYGLKNFAPIIMVPHHFSPKEKRSVYWSMHMPTHYESIIKPKTPISTLSALREIKDIISYFKQVTIKNTNKNSNHSNRGLLNEIQFDFFHSEPDTENQIKLSLSMPKEDKSLIQSPAEFGHRVFSDVSPFVRGCVRFSVID